MRPVWAPKSATPMQCCALCTQLPKVMDSLEGRGSGSFVIGGEKYMTIGCDPNNTLRGKKGGHAYLAAWCVTTWTQEEAWLLWHAVLPAVHAQWRTWLPHSFATTPLLPFGCMLTPHAWEARSPAAQTGLGSRLCHVLCIPSMHGCRRPVAALP